MILYRTSVSAVGDARSTGPEDDGDGEIPFSCKIVGNYLSGAMKGNFLIITFKKGLASLCSSKERLFLTLAIYKREMHSQKCF